MAASDDGVALVQMHRDAPDEEEGKEAVVPALPHDAAVPKRQRRARRSSAVVLDVVTQSLTVVKRPRTLPFRVVAQISFAGLFSGTMVTMLCYLLDNAFPVVEARSGYVGYTSSTFLFVTIMLLRYFAFTLLSCVALYFTFFGIPFKNTGWLTPRMVKILWLSAIPLLAGIFAKTLFEVVNYTTKNARTR